MLDYNKFIGDLVAKNYCYDIEFFMVNYRLPLPYLKELEGTNKEINFVPPPQEFKDNWEDLPILPNEIWDRIFKIVHRWSITECMDKIKILANPQRQRNPYLNTLFKEVNRMNHIKFSHRKLIDTNWNSIWGVGTRQEGNYHFIEFDLDEEKDKIRNLTSYNRGRETDDEWCEWKKCDEWIGGNCGGHQLKRNLNCNELDIKMGRLWRGKQRLIENNREDDCSELRRYCGYAVNSVRTEIDRGKVGGFRRLYGEGKIYKMKVKELKELCKENGLKVSGKKAELIERLYSV